ncbi:hypothetical protein D3C71_1507240 [compost metagenome]
MRADLAFQLERRDVLAAPADHVLQPVHEKERAVAVAPERVTRVEPAIAHGRGGRFGVAVVAGKQRPGPMRADQQFADLAVRHRAVLRIAHAKLEPGPRRAAAPCFGQPGTCAQRAGDLGHVVDRVQVYAEARLERRGVFAERHDERLFQRVIAVARRWRLLEQEVGHDAQQQHHRAPGIAYRVPELGGAEFRHHGDRSAAGQHRIHIERAAAMEDGARDHAAVVRRDAIERVRPHGVKLHI